MKRTLITACLTVFCLSKADLAFAQYPAAPGEPSTTGLSNAVSDIYTHLSRKTWELNSVKARELESVKSKTIGTTFLTDDWVTGTLYITSNRVLENQPFKYDIENNLFLLRGEDEAQPGEAIPYTVINGVIVLAFETQDKAAGTKRYLNSINAGFKNNGAPAPGFVEMLVDGTTSLYLQTTTTTLKANYNMALNVGDREDRVVKEKVYFVRKKGQEELVQVSKNKKYDLSPFSDKQAEINRYIKGHKLKLSNEQDLIQLVTYYNSL